MSGIQGGADETYNTDRWKECRKQQPAKLKILGSNPSWGTDYLIKKKRRSALTSSF